MGRRTLWTSIEVVTHEMIEKIHEMVLTDRRLKVRQILDTINIPHGPVVSILSYHLDMIRESYPQNGYGVLVTNDHKGNRVTNSKKCLVLFNLNPDEISHRSKPVDEI